MKEELLHWYDQILEDNTEKVVRVKELFQLIGSDTMTRAAIENYTKKAFDVLDEISISEANSLVLKQFGQNLMTRTV